VAIGQPDASAAAPIVEPEAAMPSLAPSPTPAAVAIVDGVTYLVGRWSGQVRQTKNPFIRRDLVRPVRTECRRLSEPWRVFCRNDWGIIEDWVVMRHDPAADRYWYEDSDGLRASAQGGDRIVYEGSRVFEGRTVLWRLTCLRQGEDAFALRMEWSRKPAAWHTIYEASFRRSP
jgi:hypothetical protein